MKVCKTVCSACLMLILAGCTIPIGPTFTLQQGLEFVFSKKVFLYYEGPVLPLEDVGVVSYDASLMVKVFDSSGKEMEPMQTYGKKSLAAAKSSSQYHFLPGNYDFSFGYSSYYCSRAGVRGGCAETRTERSEADIHKIVKIQKGDVIHFNFVREGSQWSVVMKDDSGELDKIRADYEEVIKLPIKQHD